MNIASDISNLLGRFGANANGYLEVENTIEYKELPKTAVVIPVGPVNSPAGVNETEDSPPAAEKETVSAPPSVAAANSPHSAGERVEPVIVDLPADTDGAAPSATATATAPDPVPPPVFSSSLRSLLAEVALKRESQARAQNEETALHTSLNVAQPLTPAQVIAIVSPKGGVGKTTICAALAGALHGKGRVIAIDLDPQNALQYHLGAGSDAAPAGAALTEERWSSLLRSGAAGTCVLSYEAISEEGPRALEQRIQKDRHWLSRQLGRMNLGADDVVILDTPAGRTPYLEQALDVADQVVVVVTPDAASFLALDHIGDLFDQHGDCSYVVNQFDASRTFCQDMLEVLKRRFGSKLIGVVPLDHAISEGLAYGVNTLMENRKSPAWHEIQAIGDVLKSESESHALAGIRA
ncbi:cellulose biosynthesis protein BcsQ [Herbaspirillum sp. RV1423]|uniref:cellulose biosynthesis protein BcsQ n=1 Tax=Herbaspirillum sp. RV1423 TaxID=1443993 RepID=UPI0004ADF363|nr:cellulose biosynthesis protein BcsQ [Herbaspirillum sp. RV1423]